MERYRLVIKKGRSLKIGLHSYTYDEAVKRQAECAKAGIKFTIMSEKKIFN